MAETEVTENDDYTCIITCQSLKIIPREAFKKTLKTIDLSCNFITSIRENDFNKCSMIKQLKLYSNKIQEIRGLQYLSKLEDLQLQHNEIKTVGRNLSNLKNLKYLRLDSNRIRNIPMPDICSLNNLTYIDLSGNNLENIDSLNILSSLEQLICTHNNIRKIANLKSLKKLEDIDVGFNDLTDISGLKGLSNLKNVNIENNKMKSIQNVGILKSLQDLKIAGNFFTNLKHICEQFNFLEILDVSNNNISHVEQLMYLKNLPELKELTLYNNPVVNDENKTILKEIADEVKVEVLDGTQRNHGKLNSTTKPMRPMSANQMISTRQIEEQFRTADFCMSDFEDRIESQFTVIRTMIAELPTKGSTLFAFCYKFGYGHFLSFIPIITKLIQVLFHRCLKNFSRLIQMLNQDFRYYYHYSPVLLFYTP